MSNTATLAPVTSSVETVTGELALNDARPALAVSVGQVTKIVSRTDASKVLGRKITFDVATLSEFKDSLNADKTLNAAAKKAKRQEFLNADNIKQRQLLGEIALRTAYQADEFAPMGRVPDSMELRKNGSIKLISVESFIGKVRTETPAQKIARLERELREAIASASKPVEAETEVITSEVPADVITVTGEAEPVIEGDAAMEA